MHCPNCGKELNENQKFCGGCGSDVSHLWQQAAPAPVEPAPAVVPAPVEPTPVPAPVEAAPAPAPAPAPMNPGDLFRDQLTENKYPAV